MYESNPAKNSAAKAEAIRKQYMERGTTKLDELTALDSKVKTPGMVISSIIGVLGALIMGAGMSNVMVWDNMTLGLALGIPGLLMLVLVYPIYSGITNHRKKKYAQRVMDLSAAIINGQEESK